MQNLKLLFLAFTLTVLGACASVDYDMPATLAVDGPGGDAAELASRRLTEAMGADGDFQTGDLVRISYPYMPALDTEQRVQPSGLISPPLLPPIQTRGLTAADLQRRLEADYVGKLHRPYVAVSLVEYNRKPAVPEFFVLGEVIAPGPKEYREGLTLMEALARAGGANRSANLKKVVVIEPNGETLNTRMIDFQGLLAGRSNVVPVLSPNAVVIVPPTSLALTASRAQQIRSIVGFSGLQGLALNGIVN